ncbi:MAG: transposase [Oscillospiraceae bacterium]|nr:transposase [Oscillospiraceae bacterium]
MKKSCAADGKDSKIIQYIAVKIRLHPTEEQTELIEKTFSACRYLWNKMLSDVQEFYAATDIHFIPTPARYKTEAPFLKEVDSQALTTTHQQLRQAFLHFFRNPAAFQYPKFKKKKDKKDSFTVYCRQYCTGPSIRLNRAGIQMPKLGLIRTNVYRIIPAEWSVRYVTVTKSKSGKYFCSVTFGFEALKPETILPVPETTLGLNYSLTRFYVDSEGGTPELPAIAKSKEKLIYMQQKLSRMEQGSKNYEKQLQKIRLLHEHIANQRRDFIHKESRRIANAWDAVCVRDSDLVELSQKLKPVNGNVMDISFGRFRLCLKYKLEQQGKQYIVVDRLAPVARTCHACGHVNEKLNTHDRNWICPNCGAVVSRAVNSAQNLRDMGLAQLQNKGKRVA